MSALNPFTLEVVRNAIFSIAEEMRAILMRSARAPLLKEAGDLSCVLTDAQGRLIAQGKDLPIHLGVMAFTVKEFLKKVPAESLRPGDMYFTNAMDVGGNHLPDVKAIKPIFFQGQLIAFAVNLAHWPDVGGALPGSYVPFATEIYQEGLHIPPIRLFDEHGVDRQLLNFILYNIRGDKEREGDINAQYACNEVASRRLLEVFERYGTETVLACMERFLDESEALMRAAIREVADGIYSGEDYLDNDAIGDKLVKIAVDITISGDRIDLDFSRSDPQVAGPMNATYFMTCSGAYYAVKALLGPSIPANEGCYRPISVIDPEGSVLNPAPWAPRVGGNHETSQRVVDAVFRALAPIVPDRVVAGGVTTAGILIIGGRHDDTGVPFIYYETHGGGEGAQSVRDGANGIRVHLGNTMNTPIESVEAEYPFLIEEYMLRPNSAGRGRLRGGTGLVRTYRILSQEAQGVTMIERCKVPPWGIFGGEPGVGYRVTLNPGAPSERSIRGKESFTLRRGDVVRLETAGGGGYGPPEDRSEDLESADRLQGYVE